MQIANREFRPRLIPTIVFLLILPVLLRLGFWQLDRAEEKRQLIVLFKQQNEQGSLRIKDYLSLDEKLNYRKSRIQGQYNSKKQIFIDNKIHNNQTGVFVVTPFKLKNSEYNILVNRGWVPMLKNRSRLPEVTTTTELLNLSGKIKIIGEKPFMLGDRYQSNEGWPALVQWLNIEDIENKTGLKLLPYIFLLDKNEKSGYVREWKPVVMQPEKSTSYAVQWFALATALVIIYIVVNLKKRESEIKDAE